MNSGWRASWWIGCAGLLLASAAPAQDGAVEEAPPDYAAPGIYAVLQGAYLLPRDAEGEIERMIGGASDVDPSVGVAGRIGYRLHPRLAAELHFEWRDEWDFQVSGIDRGLIEGWSAGVNAKVFLFTGRIQPYVLAGMGATRIEIQRQQVVTESQKTRFSGRVGLGTDLWLTERWGLNASGEYVLPSGALSEFDYVSLLLGIQHRF